MYLFRGFFPPLRVTFRVRLQPEPRVGIQGFHVNVTDGCGLLCSLALFGSVDVIVLNLGWSFSILWLLYKIFIVTTDSYILTNLMKILEADFWNRFPNDFLLWL